MIIRCYELKFDRSSIEIAIRTTFWFGLNFENDDINLVRHIIIIKATYKLETNPV